MHHQDRITRVVTGWDADLLVHPHMTFADWRALRRPARRRAAAGFLLSAALIAVAATLLIVDADDRLGRSGALAAALAALVIAAVTTVGLIESRRNLDERFPQWFSRRRVPGVRRAGGEVVRESASRR